MTDIEKPIFLKNFIMKFHQIVLTARLMNIHCFLTKERLIFPLRFWFTGRKLSDINAKYNEYNLQCELN